VPRTLSSDIGTNGDPPFRAKLTAEVPTPKAATVTTTTRAHFSTWARRPALTGTAAGTFSETRGKPTSLPFRRQRCERTLTDTLWHQQRVWVLLSSYSCQYPPTLTSDFWFNAY
jgi:hypothetical protein